MKQLDDDVTPPASFLNNQNYTKWYVGLVSYFQSYDFFLVIFVTQTESDA